MTVPCNPRRRGCRVSPFFPVIGFLASFVLVAVPFPSSQAIAPPHPELLEESRRHRSLHETLFPNISYASQTSLPSGIWEPASAYKRRLDPDDLASEECDTCLFGREICRHLSAQECQEVEDQMIAQAGRTRQFVASAANKTKQQPSSFTTHSTVKTLSTTSRGEWQQGQSIEIRTLVILMAWSDQQWKQATMDKSRIGKLWNGVGTDEWNIPTGSIANYTQTQSYGKVTLKADIVGWRLADNTERHYADGRSGLPKAGSTGPGLSDAFAYILAQLDAEGFNFDPYDADDDGFIDHIQFLHTGYSAETGGVDCNSNARMEDRIWSHMLPAAQSSWMSTSGKKLGAWSVSSVFSGRCGKEIAPLGIMMHEFYHTLGLVDLYDRDGVSPGLGGLGAYDMISSPFGANGDQQLPGSLSPWSKLDIGFANAVEIIHNGTYTARPSNEFSDYFIIKKGFDDEREYILIENRNNVGMDEALWSNGLLIYKIDETNGVSGNRRRGYPGMDGWPGNGQHYPVALLQADGDYNLERGQNNGDIGDFFRLPNQKLEPGNGEKLSTQHGNYPNTDGYAFGDIYSSRITIDNFKQTSPPGTFSFRVTFGYEPPCQNFRLSLQADDYPNEITWTLSEDSSSRILMRGEGNGNSEKCLPMGQCYAFEIIDAYGDGMCCQFGEGKYYGYLGEDEIFKGGTTFKDSETKKFCVDPVSSEATPSPPPANQPTPPPAKHPSQSSQQPTKAPTSPPVEQPTKQPSEGPTISPSQRPTKAPTQKAECEHDMKVYIRTDGKPSETTWEITTISGIYLTGYRSPQDIATYPLLPDTTYMWSVCINGSHSLYFKIYDSGSDGIQPPGGFLVRINGVDIDNNGNMNGAQRTVDLRVGTRRLKAARNDDNPVVSNSGAIMIP